MTGQSFHCSTLFIRITLGALNADAWALPKEILIYWSGVGHGLSPLNGFFVTCS